MKKHLKFSDLALIILLIIFLGVPVLAPNSAKAAGTSYYIDCSAATNGSSTQASPWNSLSNVSSYAFAAGDQVLFKRGTVCNGSLLFQRSGASGSPITLSAYGSGALPIINGAGQPVAVKLNNTSYVTIKNLEIKNSTRYGLFATSSITGVVEGLTIQNLVVHDVTGGTMDVKDTGLVLIEPGIKGSKFTNVLVDGVTAYNTTLWAGILVYGEYLTGDMSWAKHAKDPSLHSSNIIIQNSTVHNTYGDGIAVYMGNGVILQNNIVYLSGQETDTTIGTPNAIWTWASNNVLVQGNEAYDNNSAGADGGAFDADYWSNNTTIQYNYAHHNSAYCVGIFGAESYTNTNTIVRYNICSNNGYENNPVGGYQEIYFCTWNSGSLSNIQVYNNIIYTTVGGAVGTCPGAPNPTFKSGQPLLWLNNLVVSTVANIAGDGMAHIPWTRKDYNLYYYTGGSTTGSEVHGIYNQNPLVNSLGYAGIGRPVTEWTLLAGSPAINAGVDACAGITGCTTGARDFFGNAIPIGGYYDIGAYESGGAPLPTFTPTNTPGGSTATPSNTFTPTKTPTSTLTPTPGGMIMHVAAMYSSDLTGTPKTTFIPGIDSPVYWRVRILDAYGNPVSGVTVVTQPYKPDSSTWGGIITSTTGLDGWAVFSKIAPKATGTGAYTVKITSVAKISWTYNTGANVITTITFTEAK